MKNRFLHGFLSVTLAMTLTTTSVLPASAAEIFSDEEVSENSNDFIDEEVSAESETIQDDSDAEDADIEISGEADDSDEDVTLEIEGEDEEETPEVSEDVFGDGTSQPEAGANELIPQGSCGANMTWRLEKGILYINGTGEMTSNGWWSYSNNPLYDLHEVQISEGVTSICDGAFAYGGQGMGITTITLPSTLTSIGENAFYGNPLTDNSVIKISSKITSIGDGAFRDTDITVLDLSAYTGGTIPESLAAGCDQLVSVTLPSKFTEIGREAFRNCKKITQFTLPDGVKEIGAGAFAGCTLLKKINLPGSVTKISRIDYEDTWKGFIALGIFQDCPQLKTAGPGESYNINLQWGAGDELPNGTFNAANCLESVVIPTGMIGVQKNKDSSFPVSGWDDIGTSFGYATSLKSVKLPDSFTEFDYNAFKGCSSLETVNIPKGTKELNGTFIGCSSLKSIHIPDGVTVLNGTFGNCTSLTTVNIPDSVTSLKGSPFPSVNTFEGCKALISLNVPASVTNFPESGAFKNSGLISAGPPESGAGLIYNWTDKIPYGAFAGMNLQTFYFADGIAEIGDYAFSKCTGLKRIAIPETVKTLGDHVFEGCKELTTVKIPTSLTKVGYCAFADCTSLKNINFRGDAPEFEGYVFYQDTLTAYYPKDNKTWTRDVRQSYEGKVVWKPYAPGKPVDVSKERSVTLNGGGTASARFFLTDENGDALDEQEFTFVRRANGKIEEFGSFGYMTDFDGGYSFFTPYYADPSKETKDDAEYEVTWTDEDGKKHTETFTLHVTVKPATYTETWTAGFGAEASASGSLLGAGHEGESVISLVHKGNGAQDLILGINLSDSAKAKLSDKLSFEDGKYEAVNVSGSAKATQYSSYAITIKDFDPNNTAQQKKVTQYLSVIYLMNLDLSGVVGKVSVLWKSVFGSSIPSNALDQFEVSESGIKVNLSSGSTTLTVSSLNDVIDDIKLGAMSGSTTYSASEKKENGITTISAGVNTSETMAKISGSILSLLGETGLFGYHNVNSVSASVQSDGAVSYQESSFESGDVEEVGYNELISSTSYKVSDGESLINGNSTLKNLSYGSLIPTDSGSLEEAGEAIKKSDLQYSYSVTDTLSNTYSWNPSVDVFKNSEEAKNAETDSNIKASLKLGLSFSYKHGWKTETDNGTIKQDTVLTDADSSSSIRQARNDKDSANLGTVLGAAMKGVAASVQDSVGSVIGSLGSSISQGLSSLTSSVKDGLNWEVGLFGRSSKASSLSVESYAVETVASEAQAAALSAGDTEAATTANSVGEAVVVYVKDSSTGEEVTDLSANPMELSLQYTEADLEAAGADLSKVKNLGLYRYDEESGAYIFVESTLDESKKQFAATITKAGEYILIYDGAAPAVTDIRVSDRTSEPVITASVTDISGVTEITMSVDGEELVNKDNFAEYYDAKTGTFTYKMTEGFAQGAHTVVFGAKDQKGQATDSVSYEFKVNSAPEFTEITVPKHALTDAEKISVSAKVSSASDEKLLVSAKAVYVPYGSSQDTEEIACRMKETKDGWTGKVYPGRSMSSGDQIKITFTVSNENGEQTTSAEYQIQAVDGTSDYEYEDGNTWYRFNLATNTISYISTEDHVLTIPETIDGVPVYTVNLSPLEELDDTISKIIFPATVKKITTYNTNSSTIVIQGYTNSAADYFAQEYNLKFEAVGTVEDEGISGDYSNLSWNYRNDGTLTISGTGDMEEEYYASRYNWYPYHEKIRKVVITEGVTSIGGYAFGSEYKNLKEAVIAKSVTSIGYDNFNNESCTILGYYGSGAYDYAKSHGIEFKAVENLKGNFGENNALTWTYDGGKLTISGNGKIPDYTADGQVPWSAISKSEITEVVLKNGITGIGAYTFADMYNVQKWSLPDTLTSIGAYAFLGNRSVTQCVIPSGVTEVGECALGYQKGGYGDNGYDQNLICAMADVIIRSDSAAVKSYGEKNGLKVLGTSERWQLTEDYNVYIWDDVYYDGGNPVRPNDISVWDPVHQRSLTENVDYELTFENNTEAGDATIIVNGIGIYEGTLRKTFRIRKQSWYVYVSGDSPVTLNTSAKVQYYTVQVGGEYEQLKFTADDSRIKVDQNGKVTIPANYSGTFKIIVTALETDRYDSDWDYVEIVVKGAHVHSYGSWKVTRQATALAAGQKKRTCTGCGKSETASIAKLRATIKLKAASLVMKKGQTTAAMSVYGFAKGDYLKAVKAANSKIVQVSAVNKNGTFKLKAKAVGKTTLTITLASGLTRKVTLTVQKGTVKTTRITGISSKATLQRGKSLQLKPALAPITSQEKITYATSNKAVAIVSKTGKITAKKKGKAVITVKSGTKKVKITVTVK